MHSQLSYKKIAIHESAELTRSVSLTAPDTSNSPTQTGSSLGSFLALKIALGLLAPLLVFAALFLGCGESSDFERAGQSDSGAISDQYDPNTTDASANSPDDTNAADTEPNDAANNDTGTDGSTTSGPFPIGFEPSGSGPCALPSNVSTTQAHVESAPHGGSLTPNPDGGNCYLRITQMTSDGVVTVEFPNHVPINGTHLTFDVSFKDANQVGSPITFLVGLADNDDTLAYASNTVNMLAGGWYRVSIPIADLLDMDIETGDGVLSPGAKRFQIQAFNSSVGTDPYDQVSGLDFDNITLTNSDQTAAIATPTSETDGGTGMETDTGVPEDTPDAAGEDTPDAGGEDTPDAAEPDTIPDAIPDEMPGDDAAAGMGNIENFPIGLEAANPEDCELPENVSAIDAEIESAPYEDNPLPLPNPNGGNCFFRINQMASNGIVTIEFPDYVNLVGNFLTFDVSFGDINEIGAAIMFLLDLADDDDTFAYASNTVNMLAGSWYRVSLPLSDFLDTDPESGDGELNPGVKRFQIRAFNASVGTGPYDQVSELDFDNFDLTADNQTGEL